MHWNFVTNLFCKVWPSETDVRAVRSLRITMVSLRNDRIWVWTKTKPWQLAKQKTHHIFDVSQIWVSLATRCLLFLFLYVIFLVYIKKISSHLTSSSWAEKSYLLMAWQMRLVAMIYGTRRSLWRPLMIRTGEWCWAPTSPYSSGELWGCYLFFFFFWGNFQGTVRWGNFTLHKTNQQKPAPVEVGILFFRAL